MTSKDTGQRAELAAKVYLEMRGFKILEQNYRRPRCEIDIIAEKANCVHLIEVKYRNSFDQGGGLDAVTSTKLKQMQFAAYTWIDESKWKGEYVLSVVEVAGPNFSIINFIENVY